jgi:hypothetical protein
VWGHRHRTEDVSGTRSEDKYQVMSAREAG